MVEFPPFTESKNALLYVQEHIFSVAFLTCNITFLCTMLLVRSQFQEWDHPLTTVQDCLLNIVTITLNIWGSFPSSIA